MNAPIRNAFDCSSRTPMRRHFVSGFPRALLSLSQEKSSGVEIVAEINLEFNIQYMIPFIYHFIGWLGTHCEFSYVMSILFNLGSQSSLLD